MDEESELKRMTNSMLPLNPDVNRFELNLGEGVAVRVESSKESLDVVIARGIEVARQLRKQNILDCAEIG